MTLAFYLFLFIVAAEYVGLGNFVPIYNALPIPLLISFVISLRLISIYSFKPVLEFDVAKYYIVFVFLTAFAMVHGLIQSYAIAPLKTQIGYFMFIVIAFYLIENKKNIFAFAWMLVGVHVFLVLLNFNKLGHERLGSFKGSFFLGDGNDFAWSLNMTLPIAFFLFFSTKKFIFKMIALGGAAFLLLGIVGTQSRGASLALLAGFIYYFLYVSNKKFTALVIICMVGMAVVFVAPSNYFARMETISNYEEDTSAMGRIKAWKTATEMAVDHPLLGVGAGSFNSAYGRLYRKPTDPVRWISTHSVYFKVLAEYGFPGVLIYLLIIISCLKTNNATVRLIERSRNNTVISVLWPKFLNWSIVSWAVGAMFLTGIDYPHLFLLVGLTMSANRIVKNTVIDDDEPKIIKPWDKDVSKVKNDVFS
ncbi:MAG: O-antigen ligase family protein [Gammaproteobacteria bacterium]|nr:O-antigen ligase family protein [Gammaproteobacteria bacterium]